MESNESDTYLYFTYSEIRGKAYAGAAERGDGPGESTGRPGVSVGGSGVVF
jgi:hypothetical protein